MTYLNQFFRFSGMAVVRRLKIQLKIQMFYWKKTTTYYVGGCAEEWKGSGKEVEIRMSKSPARASGLKPIDTRRGDSIVRRFSGNCDLTPVMDLVEIGFSNVSLGA